MNWRVWDAVESVLDENGVRPMVAVVPDNQDPKLRVDLPRADFWDRVRGWQGRGWSIALHGHQHVYVNQYRGLMRLRAQSEFAGLSAAEQERKLTAGVGVFTAQGVKPDAWVAPSHSFDWTTVGLLPRVGIRVISDGLWPWPFTDARGMTWLPCQLWSFLPRGPGIWTVCYHINTWGSTDVDRFRRSVQEHAERIMSPFEAIRQCRERRLTLRDRLWARWDLFRYHQLREWRHKFRS